MDRQRSFRVAALGGLLGLLVVAGPVAAGPTADVQIGETNNRYHFSPVPAYVNLGGTVAWTNGSDAPHTVTSDTGSELASSYIGAGKTYSHTFAAAGTFTYHCAIHPYMVGTVIVLAAGGTPPPTDALAPTAPATRDPASGIAVLGLVGLAGAALALRRFRPQA